jgi:hypothetical protein
MLLITLTILLDGSSFSKVCRWVSVNFPEIGVAVLAPLR